VSVTLRGVTDTPFRLGDVTPRRRRWLFPLIACAAVAALIGAGIAAYAITQEEPPAATVAAPAATSAAALDEHAACVKLNPLLLRASEMYAAFVKDGTTPRADEASALRGQLREIQKVAPADMSADIGQVMKGVVLLPRGGSGIDFQDWQNAGLSLSTRCAGAV
jgi:hypothetical protein